MKAFITGLLKGRRLRWCLAAMLVAATGLSLAWAQSSRHYRWGGAWVGGVPGFVFNCLQIPLDPDGQTEAIRVDPLMWGSDIAGLLAAFGADTLTGAVGQGRMISNDTGLWTLFAYAQNTGNPPATTAVAAYAGTWKFTSLDTAVIIYSVTVYPISADGFSPDLTTPLYGPSDLVTNDVKRVPILE